jgi:hypothetical protein
MSKALPASADPTEQVERGLPTLKASEAAVALTLRYNLAVIRNNLRACCPNVQVLLPSVCNFMNVLVMQRPSAGGFVFCRLWLRKEKAEWMFKCYLSVRHNSNLE